MRSKAPLVLMEQMVMLLVFALAAALCLQAFVKSDEMSRRSEARDRAVVEAQNAAELIRYYGGDAAHALYCTAEQMGAGYEHGAFWLDYDGDWNPIPNPLPDGAEAPDYVYRLEVTGVPTEAPGLWKSRVAVVTGIGLGEEPEILFEIEVAWQEDSAHE